VVESTFKLNPEANAALATIADRADLGMDAALGAALAVAKKADPGDVKAAAEGGEDADAVTGRDWIRIGILTALFVLLTAMVFVSWAIVSPRSIDLDQAAKICATSATATGAKSCDPAALLTAHETQWQSSFLAILGALFAPILALFSASIGYYFAKGSNADVKSGA
jgi:hypothetical protein